ncbi:putative uncharacterized transposon-derived protein F54H12.3 [Stylophora pistillata]|uniref:Uncharacterized transposon-derived protein F54H12.3 n=1 Tax=Stylophora pistillata TaxID=50429 RepID=A0A2B4RD59_STYPI|nr:putative uncharacterized transposon-derived protein F54H12.3 [Stylophora pistillata]
MVNIPKLVTHESTTRKRKVPGVDFLDEEYRMLMAGPSGSGKTNTLCYMLREPLVVYDEIYIYTPNVHQDLIQDLARIMHRHSQKLGYEILHLLDPDQILDTTEYPSGCRKVVIFDDLITAPKGTQNKILKHFIDGRHHQISPVYLSQSYHKTPVDIRLNCSHMIVYMPPTQRHRKLIADENCFDGLANMAQQGLANAVKSDYAKSMFKKTASKYLDQALDDMSKKISGGSAYDVNQVLPMSMYAPDGVNDPTHPLYEGGWIIANDPTHPLYEGGSFDLHKVIGKLPKPKSGWTLPGHKYTGPYNDLDKQLRFSPKTGMILEIYDPPTGPSDAVAMQHDVDYSVCADKPNPKKCKNAADRKMVTALDAIPYSQRQWGHWAARNIINTKKSLAWVWVGKKKVDPDPQGWQEELADELHKPIRRNFTKRRVIVNGIDEIWCSDLVEMQKFAKWNKGYRYLLMVLDIFSKYGWIVPLKNKKGESVAEGFERIFTEGRVPKRLWVDKGTEYYNSHVKDLMKANDVEMYSTENEEKSSVCERWNRTIKTKMWKQFTIQNNTVYTEGLLPKILKEYNNTKHRSIGMTPVEASKKKNENAVYLKLYGEHLKGVGTHRREKPKFAVGDHVRISKFKRKLFDKGYTPNWSEEIFVVDEVHYTKPITYKLKDLLGEEIKGSFYEQEILRAKQSLSGLFRIEKVIRRRKGPQGPQALVKWSGYPEKFNSWVDESELQKL